MTKDERRRLMPFAVRAALASVAMACFLLALKGFAAWQTGSVAMLGSLADTGLDLLASLVTLYGVRLAATPADHDHRFGHGKAEALAALFQVALITASAAGIAWSAIRALGQDAPTSDASFGIGVSIVAILATVVLLWYQRRIIRQTGIGRDHGGQRPLPVGRDAQRLGHPGAGARPVFRLAQGGPRVRHRHRLVVDVGVRSRHRQTRSTS